MYIMGDMNIDLIALFIVLLIYPGDSAIDTQHIIENFIYFNKKINEKIHRVKILK